MTRGLYTSASGLIAEFSRMEAISNNLANAETPSFKKDIPVFDTYLKKTLISDPFGIDKDVQRAANSSVKISKVGIDWQGGALKDTGKSSDLAIEGEGFFKVMTKAGVRYTRHGSLTLDASGTLVDAEGNNYLGTDDGKITFKGLGGSLSDFRISSDGSILLNGVQVKKIKIVDFKKPYSLIKRGKGYYMLPGQDSNKRKNPLEKAAVGASVLQGFREQANVHIVEEMVNMIESMRTFESYQKMVQSSMNETTRKAVNELGRVRG